jgi:hypothetical protein
MAEAGPVRVPRLSLVGDTGAPSSPSTVPASGFHSLSHSLCTWHRKLGDHCLSPTHSHTFSWVSTSGISWLLCVSCTAAMSIHSAASSTAMDDTGSSGSPIPGQGPTPRRRLSNALRMDAEASKYMDRRGSMSGAMTSRDGAYMLCFVPGWQTLPSKLDALGGWPQRFWLYLCSARGR